MNNVKIFSLKTIDVRVNGLAAQLVLTKNRNLPHAYNVSLLRNGGKTPVYRTAPGEWTVTRLLASINATRTTKDIIEVAPEAWQKEVIVDKYGAVVDETGSTLRTATVAEYFHARLGRWLDDPYTKSVEDARKESSPYSQTFHIQTGCGEDCKVVIDFARRACLSPGVDVDTIVRLAEDQVLTFVYG